MSNVHVDLKALKVFCIAVSFLALIVTLVFFGWWAMKDRIEFGANKFDQVAWMTSSVDSDKGCLRGDMAYDLQQNILFHGMSRKDAMVLLGRPTWEESQQIEYDLGNCIHVIHGLRLFFDEDNRLTVSRIVQH